MTDLIATAVPSNNSTARAAPSAPSQLQCSDLFRLDQRTIVITGGLGAVGLTVAVACLEQGADVVLLDLALHTPDKDNSPAWDHAVSLASQQSRRLTYETLDVTSSTAVSSVFSHVASTSRYPIRGLLTAHGEFGTIPALQYPHKAFERLQEVNITGNFLVAQAAAREMHAANVAGSIVLIASMSGTNVNQGVTTCAYNASKAGVLQLARSLAAEWGGGYRINDEGVSEKISTPPIRVNTLSPGYIRTNATGPTLSRMPHLEQVWEAGNMLGRLSLAHEYRAPVLFLLADGSSFMTAADLRIDAGHCSW